jgi:hypothetical protein
VRKFIFNRFLKSLKNQQNFVSHFSELYAILYEFCKMGDWTYKRNSGHLDLGAGSSERHQKHTGSSKNYIRVIWECIELANCGFGDDFLRSFSSRKPIEVYRVDSKRWI